MHEFEKYEGTDCVCGESLSSHVEPLMTWEVNKDGNVPSYVYRGLKRILQQRETELLELVGPCSTKFCTLHKAHSGPCNLMLE